MLALAEEYLWAADWLRVQAEAYLGTQRPTTSAQEVFIGLANDFDSVAQALRVAVEQCATIKASRLVELRKRLAWTFDAELVSFERKAFISLSHEANKAMNLNAYIGLMGATSPSTTPKGARSSPSSTVTLIFACRTATMC